MDSIFYRFKKAINKHRFIKEIGIIKLEQDVKSFYKMINKNLIYNLKSKLHLKLIGAFK